MGGPVREIAEKVGETVRYIGGFAGPDEVGDEVELISEQPTVRARGEVLPNGCHVYFLQEPGLKPSELGGATGT